MVKRMAERPSEWELLELAVEGTVTLRQIIEHRIAGSLEELRRLDAPARFRRSDVNIEPLVDVYFRRAFRNRPLTPVLEANYRQQLSRLIPVGQPFARADFHASYVLQCFRQLSHRARPFSVTTRRHYFNTWWRFYQWSRELAGLPADAFALARAELEAGAEQLDGQRVPF
jgi:hypothetical protein